MPLMTKAKRNLAQVAWLKRCGFMQNRARTELIEEILRAIEEFIKGVPQFDDVTLVVVKRKDKPT